MTAPLRNVGIQIPRCFRRALLPILIAIACQQHLTGGAPHLGAQEPKKAAPTGEKTLMENSYALSGQCVKHADSSTMAGVGVRLYQHGGQGSPTIEVAKALTDRDGRFAFSGLAAPRLQSHLDRLEYGLVAFLNGRPLGLGSVNFREKDDAITIRMSNEWSTLTGKVIDTDGRPVEGATVVRCYLGGQPVPGLSAMTDVDGRFKFDDMAFNRKSDGTQWETTITVLHPDHPETDATASALPADVVVALPDGCLVTGQVTDKTTGGPGPCRPSFARFPGRFFPAAATSA